MINDNCTVEFTECTLVPPFNIKRWSIKEEYLKKKILRDDWENKSYNSEQEVIEEWLKLKDFIPEAQVDQDHIQNLESHIQNLEEELLELRRQLKRNKKGTTVVCWSTNEDFPTFWFVKQNWTKFNDIFINVDQGSKRKEKLQDELCELCYSEKGKWLLDFPLTAKQAAEYISQGAFLISCGYVDYKV